MTDPQLKTPKSLRTILIIWFLLFAIVPLAFLTGFSIVRYEKAIDRELARRLEGNAREMAAIIKDFSSALLQKRDRVTSAPGFVYSLSANQTEDLSQNASNWLRGDVAAELTMFNRDGRMLFSQIKSSNGEIKQLSPPPKSAIFISEENLKLMQNSRDYSFIEANQKGRLSLILLSKIMSANGKLVGYSEQLVGLDKDFLSAIKSRLGVELVLIRSNGSVIASTHNDFYEYSKEFFLPYIENPNSPTFDVTVRAVPYEFIMYPLQWGRTRFYVAMGASKSESRAVLRGVNYAFYTVVGAVILLLIVIILIISNSILKPLEDLVAAARNLPYSDKLTEIPVKSDTEIGLLSESFNEMSRQIIRVRGELRAKITELESANSEIKSAQAQLVHSSKMSSLGALVAGVAHELNNPISFIYANMGHLKDYSDRLMKFADAAQQSPATLVKLREELEIDYIEKDLPKLIASCEDGSRRVRDIVLGLRNFSRLEEAKLKQIDVQESLENTLRLLSGETKNRIEVIRNYGQVPRVTCYESQMNQVFMNILSNAVQAIVGNGRIWISTRPENTKEGRPGVAISIQDSGQGIEPKDLDKIYDPFFSTKGVGQGTGLGLSITYGIVQNHGGEIRVSSAVGEGTEFTVIIPQEPDPSNLDKALTS
jgi:two-component system NtrC family sensor kinase